MSRYLFYMNSANLAAELIFYGKFIKSVVIIALCESHEHISWNKINVSALAYFTLPLDFRVDIPWLSITYRAWRVYAVVLAVPLGIGAMMMLFLYESPKFLANRGDTGRALEVLRAMYRLNGGNENDYPVRLILEF